MVVGFVKSVIKSKRLRGVSVVLSKTMSLQDMADIERSIAMTNSKDAALEKLFDICEQDKPLREVLEAHKADRNRLRELYQALVANGAGEWTRGHWVAASAFAFQPTLDYALQAQAGDVEMLQAACALIQYFEEGRIGPVDPNLPRYEAS